MTGRFFSKDNDTLGHSKAIVVEGQDDALFLDILLTQLGADNSIIRVIDAKGKGNIQKLLTSLSKSRDFVRGSLNHIGVIRDADDDPSAAAKEVSDALTKLGLPKVEHGNFETGRVGEFDRTVGLYIMPSGDEPGMLETLLLNTVDQEDVRLVHADGAVNAVEEARAQPFNIRDKRRMGIFLALSDYKANNAGLATKNGAFDVSSTELDDLRNFISNFL